MIPATMFRISASTQCVLYAVNPCKVTLLKSNRFAYPSSLATARFLHATAASQEHGKPQNPDTTENSSDHLAESPHVTSSDNIGRKRLADFDVAGRVFVVTGAAQGLGLAMAEALVEAGGKVYRLDRAPRSDRAWDEVAARVVPEWCGSLHCCQQDASDTVHLDKLLTTIADENHRMDDVVVAAGIQQITPAAEYQEHDATRMLSINYTGVLMAATAVYRQVAKYKCRGSICSIVSMRGLVAKKGLLSPVYNSSKAAVIQLARNLAMEWSPIKEDGTGGIRVNGISPGHILASMVLKNFEEVSGLRQKWKVGRLAETSEFKGAVLFLLSSAGSFVTGSNMVVDGGHTSW